MVINMKRPETNSLKFQIVLLLVIAVAGVLLTGVYSLQAVIRSNRAEYDEWCAEEIARFENRYMEKCYKVQSIMLACGYNENIQRLLTGTAESPYEVLTPVYDMEQSMIKLIYKYTRLDDSLLDAYIRGSDNRLYSYIVYGNEDNLHQFMEESGGAEAECVSDIFEMGNYRCFALSEPVWMQEDARMDYPLSRDRRIGTSIFTVKADFMQEELDEIGRGEQNAFLLNADGEVMLRAQGQKKIGESLMEKIRGWQIRRNGTDTMQAGGYAFNGKCINEEGWRLVVATQERHRDFYHVGTLGWLLIWPGLLACIFAFSWPVLSGLNLFVQSMTEHMERIGAGNLQAEMAVQNKKEFRQIAEGLNTMMKRINSLMDRNISLSTRLYREEAEKAGAMLLALQSQMNPHFLYNTFECIKNIAVCYDVKEIEELTTALSAILRYSLKQENIVQVEQELSCIREFITIQTIRFEDKYRILYEVDEACLHYPVLRLAFQPLVENAMKHGLEKRQENGVIAVRVFEDEARFYLQVEDNGVGMDEETVRRLTTGERAKSGSVAIGNLRSRLNLFYGRGAGLTIESHPGEGTCMTVYIEKKSMVIEEKSIG